MAFFFGSGVFKVCRFVTESEGNVSSKEVQKLKKRNLQLEEENNLLKLKIELLLDMVSLLFSLQVHIIHKRHY